MSDSFLKLINLRLLVGELRTFLPPKLAAMTVVVKLHQLRRYFTHWRVLNCAVR